MKSNCNSFSKPLTIFSRWLIGLTFLFSGFVKSVDPVGGAIKFHDYFTAWGLDFLNPAGLFLSVLLAILEFLIGFHLVTGTKLKTVSWLALLFMLFFTGLTLYIALANPVSDCGCFGDAIKLTNWQTFFKNIVLFPFAIWLFIHRNQFIPDISLFRSFLLTAFGTLIIMCISWHSYRHEPILDFRPYQTGTHIPQKMVIPDGAPSDVYEQYFTLKDTLSGKEIVVESRDYTSDSSYWCSTCTWKVIASSEPKLIQKGYESPIHGFSLTALNDQDKTEEILKSELPVFLAIIPRIDDLDPHGLKQLIHLNHLAQKGLFHLYIVSSTAKNDLIAFDAASGSAFQYLTIDETEIKTIVRSNQALVLLTQGTIAGKWNLRDIKDARVFEHPLSAALSLNTKLIELLLMLILSTLLILGSIIILKYTNKTKDK